MRAMKLRAYARRPQNRTCSTLREEEFARLVVIIATDDEAMMQSAQGKRRIEVDR